MSCNSIQSKLSAYIDGEMSGYDMQDLRAHVNNCKDCQAELYGLKAVQSILREMPATPEPPSMVEIKLEKRVKAYRSNFFRLAFLLTVPAACMIAISYMRPNPPKVEDRDVIINRQLSNDQIFDAGSDSTSGASLVHYTNFEGR
jgi:hypothetical protein